VNDLTDNWPKIRERHEAFWHGAVIDRPLVRARAMRRDSRVAAMPTDPAEQRRWFTDPGQVVERLRSERACLHCAGDAFPVAFPVGTGLVAIQAAYLGGGYRFVPGTATAWCDPIIDDWSACPSLAVDDANAWWRETQALLDAGARELSGVAAIGIPDLQGGGQILDLLRGSERLAMDLLENPDEVHRAMRAIDAAWLHYWTECNRLILPSQPGYVDWLEVWSDRPAVTVECDLAIMLSPAHFDEFFLPSVIQQTLWVERTIYHLDGPGAIRHLDSLLAIDTLDGIQWVPGAGAAPMREWSPLLQRIQNAGKLLVLNVAPADVAPLLAALRPEGLLLDVWCDTPEEADAVVAGCG